jgi:hypothetical protein
MRKLNHTFTCKLANEVLHELGKDLTEHGYVLTPKSYIGQQLLIDDRHYMNTGILKIYIDLLEGAGRVKVYRSKLVSSESRGVPSFICVQNSEPLSEDEFAAAVAQDVHEENRRLREEVKQLRAQLRGK